MKKYRVIIPPIVQEQIRSQVFYIADDSVERALTWEARLRASIDELAKLPLRHSIDAAESARLGCQVRKFVFGRTYLVFYRVNEKDRTVDIINFRHGARLPADGEP